MTLAARRATSPVTARRAAGAAKGSALRIPGRQAIRASSFPTSVVHEASRPTATLLGEAPDGTPSTRRCVGRATVTDAEDASSMSHAGVTTLPDPNVATAVSVGATRATSLPTSTRPRTRTGTTSTAVSSGTGATIGGKAGPGVRRPVAAIAMVPLATFAAGALSLASSN